uniref:Chromo domain-containing protein n=1 Tax=Lactuca sativa TaxID=4236 RepID=A0A9R1W096_LACSA|nr:hypothetical protein LSAT_V11C300154060 [Lactuca sativa]
MCIADESAVVPLEDIQVDAGLNYAERPIAIRDRKIKVLRNKEVLLVQVQWQHRKGSEFTWEPEREMLCGGTRRVGAKTRRVRSRMFIRCSKLQSAISSGEREEETIVEARSWWTSVDPRTTKLVKFGKFAETEGVQVFDTPIAIVAEEHMTPSSSNISSSVEVSDDDDDNNDDDDDDDDDDSDDIVDMRFHLFVPLKEPVNAFVITSAETETEIIIFRKPNIPMPEQMDALINELESIARKPPQAVSVTVESPYGRDKDEPNASLMPKKRRRRDPRLGVLIPEIVQQSVCIVKPAPIHENVQSVIIEPTQVHENVQILIIEPTHVQEDVQGPIAQSSQETFASGSSSAPPPPEHDVASIKLAKILAFQDSIPLSRGKGICIGSEQGGSANREVDVRLSELEQENSQKNKHISELQANLGGLTTFYFDLKDKMIGNFGDEFNGKAPETSKRVVVRPAPNSNIDQYLSSGPTTAEERREKQIKNVTGGQPQMFIKEVGKRKFADRYDDRSGNNLFGDQDGKGSVPYC